MKYKTIDIRIFDKFRNQSYYPVISEEAIDHVRNNIKTELKCSPVQGIGVFTIKDIKKRGTSITFVARRYNVICNTNVSI